MVYMSLYPLWQPLMQCTKGWGGYIGNFTKSGSEPSLILAHGALNCPKIFQGSVVLAKQIADENYLNSKLKQTRS